MNSWSNWKGVGFNINTNGLFSAKHRVWVIYVHEDINKHVLGINRWIQHSYILSGSVLITVLLEIFVTGC